MVLTWQDATRQEFTKVTIEEIDVVKQLLPKDGMEKL
jgi:hypothetical protein